MWLKACCESNLLIFIVELELIYHNGTSSLHCSSVGNSLALPVADASGDARIPYIVVFEFTLVLTYLQNVEYVMLKTTVHQVCYMKIHFLLMKFM